MRDFKNKNVFITGGASGIGLGMAQRFAQRGANLILVDIDHQALAQAQRLIAVHGGNCLTIHFDVRDPEAWQAAGDQAEAQIGPVDIFCSNAGVAGSRLSVAEMQIAGWQWTIDVNLHGTFFGVKTFLPRMLARAQPAHIVVTASLAGLLRLPENTAYSASKAAIISLCEGIRAEIAESPVGISVLCPGNVRTALIQNNDRLAPESITQLSHDEPELLIRMEQGSNPLSIADQVLKAIEQQQFWIFTHPELNSKVEQRLDEIRNALKGAS